MLQDVDCEWLRMITNASDTDLFGGEHSMLDHPMLDHPLNSTLIPPDNWDSSTSTTVDDSSVSPGSVGPMEEIVQPSYQQELFFSAQPSSSASSSSFVMPTTPVNCDTDISDLFPKDGSCRVVSYSSFSSDSSKKQSTKPKEVGHTRDEGSESRRPSVLKRSRHSVVDESSSDSVSTDDSANSAASPFSVGSGNSFMRPPSKPFGDTEGDIDGSALPVVVESFYVDLSPLLFKSISEDALAATAGHGDRVSLVKPATINLRPDSSGLEKKRIALAVMVHPKAVTNKVILIELARKHGDEEWFLLSKDVVGWVLPERLGDIKWIREDRLCVASGTKLVFLDVSSAHPLASKRPRPRTDIKGKKDFEMVSPQSVIREVEPTLDGTSVLIGDSRGDFSIVDEFNETIQTHHFSSPVNSVRNIPETVTRSCVSCALANGHVCIFDRRTPWTPRLNVTVRGDSSSELFSHDWYNNTVILGFSCGTFRSALFDVSQKKPTLIAECQNEESVGADIRTHKTRDEFVAFGPPNFCMGTVTNSRVWFSPVPPPEACQICVYGEYFDDDTLITTADDGFLRLWSICSNSLDA